MSKIGNVILNAQLGSMAQNMALKAMGRFLW